MKKFIQPNEKIFIAGSNGLAGNAMKKSLLKSVMAQMILTDAIINNKPLNIYNFGNLSRSFTFIDDVVEIIISLIYKPAFSDKLFKTDQPNTSSS